MQQDGWSSVQNDPVIATSVGSDGKATLWKPRTQVPPTRLQRPVRLCLRTRKSHAETTYGCIGCTAFVTDNAKNMDKMRRELEEEEDENQIPYLSHILNLLGQDVTLAHITKDIVEINKFFRNHQVLSSWLKGQLGSTRPQLPSEPRWKGQLICLDSYLTNMTYYIKFLQDYPDEVDSTILQKIMDMNMFRQVRDLANMLCPVTTALDLGQSGKTTITDACNIFMNLLSHHCLRPGAE